MRLGGRIDRPPRQALLARSHLGSRAGRESSDGAVDRGAAGFATLQADVVAAMAKAGQRGSRGMRQPPVAAISSSNLAP